MNKIESLSYRTSYTYAVTIDGVITHNMYASVCIIVSGNLLFH